MLIRLCVLLFLAAPTMAQESPWSTFRGNSRRTGNTDNLPGPTKTPEVAWAMKSTGHFVSSPVPSGDLVLFSAIGAFNKPDFLAIPRAPKSSTAVEPAWSKTSPFLRLPTVSSPAVYEGKLLFGDGMHQTDGAIMYCLPADGGALLWALDVPGELVHMEGSPAVVNGKAFIGAGSAGVFCVDINHVVLDGKEIDVKEVPALQAAYRKKLLAAYEVEKKKDPDFAIPPGDDKVLKPSPKAIWSQGKGKWHVDAPILVAGDKVLVASAFLDKEKLGDRSILCLDAATGKELWKAPLTYNPWGGPTLAGDTVIVTTSTISYDPKLLEGAKGEVIALDLATGKEKWKKAVPGGVLGCAACSKDSAIFTATDGKLRTFSIKDGSRVSIYDAKSPLFAPPAIVGDIAYIADLAGIVHAVDTKTGAATWTFDLAKAPLSLPGSNYGGIVVHGGQLFLATCNLDGPHVRKPTAVISLK